MEEMKFSTMVIDDNLAYPSLSVTPCSLSFSAIIKKVFLRILSDEDQFISPQNQKCKLGD